MDEFAIRRATFECDRDGIDYINGFGVLILMLKNGSLQPYSDPHNFRIKRWNHFEEYEGSLLPSGESASISPLLSYAMLGTSSDRIQTSDSHA